MSTVLVLGGTGKTGRRITSRLVDAGHTVRSAARTPGAPRPGVEPVRFDWSDTSTHDAALAGVDSVYVVPPALVVDHVAQLTDFYQRAVSARVPKAVLLSARGVDADESIPLRRAELALFAGDIEGTVIRPSWFAQNFTEGVFADGVAGGAFVTAAAAGLEPFIDADDIADVAAALLVRPGGAGVAYDLSGPSAISFAQAAEVISAQVGRTVQHVAVSSDEFVAGAVAAGVPADYAGLLASLFEVIANGWDAHVSDGVQQVLGREPRAFDTWAATAF